MDPMQNPFSPGAGSPPPELAGRAPLLEQARITLGRVKAGRPERSFLLVGLRGVGKTVLLNKIRELAVDRRARRGIACPASGSRAAGERRLVSIS